MTKALRWTNYLVGEGFSVDTLPSGELRCAIQNHVFILHPEEDDPDYFKLTYFHSWKGLDELRTCRAINAVNQQIKGVKVWVHDDILAATAEAFYDDIDQAISQFPRWKQQVAGAVTMVAQWMEQSEPGRSN